MSRRSSDLEDSQVKFEPGSSDGEQLWEAIEIVKEDPKRGFLVRWAGNDPNTGKPWPNSWSLREDCTDDLVQEWREKQRAAKASKRKRTSRISLSTSTTSRTTRHSSTGTAQPVASSSKLASVNQQRKRSHSSGARSSLTPGVENKGDEVSEAPMHKKRRVNESEAKDAQQAQTTVHKTQASSKGKGKEKAAAGSIASRTTSPAQEVSSPWTVTSGVKVGPPKRKSTSRSESTKARSRSTDEAKGNAGIAPVSTASSTRPPPTLTQSQIFALREEEEESTQTQGLPLAHHQADAENGAERHGDSESQKAPLPNGHLPSGRSSPLQLTGEAKVEVSDLPEPEELRNVDEVLRPLSPLPSISVQLTVSHNSPTVSVEHRTADSIFGRAEDPSTAQTRTSPSPQRDSRVQRKTAHLRPIPHISPSKFAPHLPRPRELEPPDSSIEQFDSPVKRVRDGSIIREWSEEHQLPPAASGSRESDLKKRTRAMKAHMEARRRQVQSAKLPLDEIMKKPTSLAFSKTNPTSEKNLADAIRGLESQPSQVQTSAAIETVLEPEPELIASEQMSSAGAVGSSDSRDRDVLREMEEMYVDLDGGQQGDSQMSIDRSSDSANAVQASSQDEIPATISSKNVFDESQDSLPDVSSQRSELDIAYKLLHMKSEENARLQAQIEGYQHHHDLVSSEVQTDLLPSALLSTRDNAEKAAFNDDREQWAREKRRLQDRLQWAEESKANAETDVNFFREQYQTASAFASTTRAENDDLLTRAKLAESQATYGVALLRATFDTRIAKLEREVAKYKALVELLTERARRTDDEVRLRAALEPELRRENRTLRADLEEAREEADENEENLRVSEGQRRKLQRVVEKLKAELEEGAKIQPTGKRQQVEQIFGDEDEEDEDYLPEVNGQALSDDEEASPRPSNGDVGSDRDVSASPDPKASFHAAAFRNHSGIGFDDREDEVYLCRWRFEDNRQLCQTITRSQEDLRLHILTEHVPLT